MDPTSLDTIVCPRCHQDLPATQETCPHCGASTRGDAHPTQRAAVTERRLIHHPWVLFVVVLHLGCLGIPFYWKLPYSRAVRIGVIAASVLYTVAAVAIIWWAIQQILRAAELVR